MDATFVFFCVCFVVGVGVMSHAERSLQRTAAAAAFGVRRGREHVFARSVTRLVLHTCMLIIVVLAVAARRDGWQGLTIARCADSAERTPAAEAFGEETVYACALLWSIMGLVLSFRGIVRRMYKTTGATVDDGVVVVGEMSPSMVLHHVVTALLIVTARLYGRRCEVFVVVALHALAEPFVDFYHLTGSMYAWRRTHAVASVMMMGAFLFTRVYVVGIAIMEDAWSVEDPTAAFVAMRVLLTTLYGLQIWWGKLMITTAVRKIAAR